MKIVVIGGTGLIGSKLVTKLSEHGQEAVAASPSLGVNTITGEGLAAALDGAAVVVDVSNSPSFEYAAALEFFETSTRTLGAAEEAAGVGHHVALSVVGAELLSESGYFRAKIAQEELIKASPIPYSIVKATPFFEVIKGMAEAPTDGNTIRIAPVLLQPMAADDVATAVGRIAEGSPVNGIVEIAGPERFISTCSSGGSSAHGKTRARCLQIPRRSPSGSCWVTARSFRAMGRSWARPGSMTGWPVHARDGGRGTATQPLSDPTV